MTSSPDATLPPPPSRPVRKDEIELHDRGLYIESWLPERRSRRKPLLFVHGELAGSWAWERFLGYFAGRGWEGHALNLRNHHWSQTADPADLSFEGFVDDVRAAADRRPDPHRLRAAGGCPRTDAAARHPRHPRAVRPVAAGLGDAAREAAARPPRPDARGRPSNPAPDGPEAARVGPRA